MMPRSPELEPGELKTPTDGADRREFVECPGCRASTPSENLNCIYCGERLPIPVGFLSSLAGGGKGRTGLVIAVLILAAFLLWVL